MNRVYVHGDDTINAFAGRNDNKEKPFRIVFFDGAMRFSRLASLAVASTHPLERDRLENLIRANASKASGLGINLMTIG